MRDIIEVIKLIGNCKNPSPENDKFQNSLDNIIEKIFFTPPESMYIRWKELQNVVFEYVPQSMFEWTVEDIKIISLLSGKSENFIANDIESRMN